MSFLAKNQEEIQEFAYRKIKKTYHLKSVRFYMNENINIVDEVYIK